jgi:hypothetical protein
VPPAFFCGASRDWLITAGVLESSPAAAEIGAFVWQRSLKVTSDTYTHVLVDGRELDLDALLAGRTGR